MGDGGLKVLDTRKTSPGMRGISKQAVKAGGAYNHRFGLYDGVLIKDNHIAAVGGSIREALEAAKQNAPRLVKIEIEITSLAQLEEAIVRRRRRGAARQHGRRDLRRGGEARERPGRARGLGRT